VLTNEELVFWSRKISRHRRSDAAREFNLEEIGWEKS